MLRNKNKHVEKRRLSSNTIATISSIVILLGLFLFFYNYINTKKVYAYDYMQNNLSKSNKYDQKKEENKDSSEETLPSSDSDTSGITNNYIGYLEIPKISLRKGFARKDSRENNVDKNIFLVDASDYPDKDKGDLIIAGHSGTGWNAFFNDLYKLEIGDTAYVEYQNKKYTYIIDDIYKQDKVGTIAIYRDYDRTTLTLVTCTNNDSKTQTVYIAYLNKIE